MLDVLVEQLQEGDEDDLVGQHDHWFLDDHVHGGLPVDVVVVVQYNEVLPLEVHLGVDEVDADGRRQYLDGRLLAHVVENLRLRDVDHHRLPKEPLVPLDGLHSHLVRHEVVVDVLGEPQSLRIDRVLPEASLVRRHPEHAVVQHDIEGAQLAGLE